MRKNYSGACDVHGPWSGNSDPCCPEHECTMGWLRQGIRQDIRKINRNLKIAFAFVALTCVLLLVKCLMG